MLQLSEYESFLTIFSLQMQQIEVVAIRIEYFSTQAYTPFHLSEYSL